MKNRGWLLSRSRFSNQTMKKNCHQPITLVRRISLSRIVSQEGKKVLDGVALLSLENLSRQRRKPNRNCLFLFSLLIFDFGRCLYSIDCAEISRRQKFLPRCLSIVGMRLGGSVNLFLLLLLAPNSPNDDLSFCSKIQIEERISKITHRINFNN